MDIAAKVNFEIRRAAVANAITCPVTGTVLDVKSAVLVYGPSGKLQAVVSPEGYRLRVEALRAGLPGVTFENAPAD